MKHQGNFTNHHKNTVDDFWDNVDILSSDQCWTWNGAQDTDGYGTWTMGGRRNIKVHRMAYELSKGEIPEGLLILHTCDNPPCCNPNHLWVGTNADNMADKMAKGRGYPPPHPKGEAHKDAKLTEKDVLKIRERYSRGNTTLKELAQEYNVTFGLIGHIVNRRVWKHI